MSASLRHYENHKVSSTETGFSNTVLFLYSVENRIFSIDLKGGKRPGFNFCRKMMVVFRFHWGLSGQAPSTSFASLMNLTENKRLQMYNTRLFFHFFSWLYKNQCGDTKDTNHISISDPRVVRAKEECILRRGNDLIKLIKKVYSTLGLNLSLKALFSSCAWCEVFSTRNDHSGFLAQGQCQSTNISNHFWSWGVCLSDKLWSRRLLISEFILHLLLVTHCLSVLQYEEFL